MLDEHRRQRMARGIARCLLLAALPFVLTSPGWALKTDDSDALVLTGSDTAHFVLPTLSVSGPQTRPKSNRLQLTLTGKRTISVEAFTYGGGSGLRPGLAGGSFQFAGSTDASAWNLPQLLPGAGLQTWRALKDQVQSVKVGLEGGRGKLNFSLQDVGEKFAGSASGLDGLSSEELQGLTAAAGTRALNLDGSYELSKFAVFSTTRHSLLNDKSGDPNCGRTITDWTNALTLTLGKSTSFRLALTDHGESLTASGLEGTQKHVTEVGGESKFGPGGACDFKFGLAQTQLATGNAAAGHAEDSLFRLTGTLGSGPGALKFSGEQTATHTPDMGLQQNDRFDLAGALGSGDQGVNLHLAYAGSRGDSASAPIDQLGSLHLDRAVTAKVKLTLDSEQHVLGTVATHATNAKSTLGLSATLSPQTKLTAGFSAYTDQGLDPTQLPAQATSPTGPQASSSGDVLLEHQVGSLQFRAEEREVIGAEAGSEAGWGVDWAHGKLPEWAANISRRHEFTDIYDYKVAKEDAWLDLPFAGTRFWMKERTGGLDDGTNTFLISHRRLLTKRCHLQLTLHERPEYEDGVNRGRPQPLRREYLELGTPFTSSLVGRAWAAREFGLDDLSQRNTFGLNLCGKLANKAQTELSLSHQSGWWNQVTINSDTVAVFYDLKVSEESKVTVKVGYTWGIDPLALPGGVDCRATIAYAKPV